MAETRKRKDIDFKEFRKLLLEERARLTDEIRGQRADLVAESREVGENESTGSSEAAAISDRGREDALGENAKDLLKQVEAALERLDSGVYGICEVTNKPIPVERLRALPWATMTVEAAERIGR